MKILKGFASVILAGIMLVCLIAISGVLMFRVFLSGPTLAKVARGMIEQKQSLDLSSMLDGAQFDSDEIDKVMEDLEEYIPEDEIYEVVGELASQLIRYETGIIDDINANSLKETLKEAAKKYEKKTGEDIDISELDDVIDDVVKDLKKEAKNSEIPHDVTNVFKVVYSNGLLIGCALVFIVCAILIVVMFKSVTPLLIHLSILGFLHGITNGILGLVMNAIPVEDASMSFVISPLKGIFLTTSFICIAVAIISIILIIILGVVKKNKKAPVQYQVQQ